MSALLVIQAAASHLRNSRTDLRLDNRGAASVLEATIQKLVISIHYLCIKLDVDLHVFGIPRDQNKLADALSTRHT